MNKSEKLVENFWKEFIDADYLERTAKLEKVFAQFVQAYEIPENKRKAFIIMVHSYFEDLIEYYENKNVRK